MGANVATEPIVGEVLPAETFDYAQLDAETRIVVQQRTSEIRTISRRAATDVIEIGQKLIEVKARLGHGNFGQWLAAEFSWSEPSAQRFMRVAERFQNRQIDGFAPSALYMLAGESVPNEAREDALRRAEAGERIGVSAARGIIAEHMATADELRPHVLEWARTISPSDARGVLQQIALNNNVGLSHFQRLDESLRAKGLRFMRADLKRAVERVIEDLPAPAPRVTVIRPLTDQELADLRPSESGAPAAIWQLEQALDKWLAVICATVGERKIILEDIKNKRDPWYTRVFVANTLPPNRTNGDVLQAAHNLLDHLNQADGRLRQLTPSSNGRTVYVEERPDNGNGSIGGPTTGSCKYCGRQLSDPAHIAAGCGPVCAAKQNNGSNGNGHTPLRANPLPTGSAAASSDADHLVEVVDAWIKDRVELGEIPDDKSSLRFILQQIIGARSAKVAPEVWRDFIRFEAWPSDTTNDQKVDAARTVLARLSGKPIDPVPPAEPTPPTYQPIVTPYDRDQQRIRQLEAALAALIEFVEGRAALSEPDPDTTAAIAAATAELRDPTYK